VLAAKRAKVNVLMDAIFRKGQAAVEYLVILAVVIIVALFVVGVLGGFPTTSSGISEKDSRVYWSNADIGIVELYLSATASGSKLEVRNNNNADIQLTSVNITDSTGANAYTYTTATSLGPGQNSAMLTMTDGAGSKCTTKGSKFSYNVNATYTRVGNAYTFTGAKLLLGTCQ
jgi:hypothetical protein